jgi:Tol biopolymer transport system component
MSGANGSQGRPARSREAAALGVVALLALLLVPGVPANGASPSTSPTVAPSPRVVPILPGEPWVAYNWNGNPGRSNGLYAVRPDGTDAHLILPQFSDRTGSWDWGKEGGLHADWSPDGSRLAFTNGVDDSWTIWVANVDGSDAHEVVPCSAPCMIVDMPAWSPDGTKLAYGRWFGPWPPDRVDATSLEILDLTTGETRIVLQSTAPAGGNPEFFHNPRWSPDGRSLVLAIVDADEEALTGSAIAVVDVSGVGLATARRITEPAMFGSYPDWHPTDDRIVFNTHDLGPFQDASVSSNLYTIRPDGTELTQITDYGVQDERATQPTWTPDGSQIIFTHIGPPPAPQGPTWQIGFIKPDGSGLRLIDGGYMVHPRLRPAP